MGEQIKKAISDIRKLDPEFDSTYISYRDAIAHWRNQGLWHDEMILGKSVLDWECGRGAFAAIFVELGAESVVGIDTWLDVDYATHILSRLPRATFHQMSIRDFAQTAGKDDLYDLIFANTVTEHLIDLSQQLVMCYDLLKSTGRLLINHDNYYGPLGSHDHGFLVSFQMGGTLAKVRQQLPGQKRLCPPRIALATGLFATFARMAERLRFLFYGEGNRIEFKGPQCWSDPRKCEASEQFRQSIIQRFPWTWDEQIESLIDPNDCDECPYYKRSRPWAHLIYQDDFRRIFPQVSFTTGYEKSSLNKVTTFQLRQYIIEAGFDIESWVPGMVTNEPPDSLTKPPYNFNLDELRTSMVTAVCSKSPADCYRTLSLINGDDVLLDLTQQQCTGEEDGTRVIKTYKVGHKRKFDITEQYKSKFRKILLETYFANWDPAHLNSEAGERDIEDHVCNRMLNVENIVLPWVGEVYDITGKSVLEIGCGTGSTTVPFALRVHTVHSYDINEQAMKAAKQRATLLGVNNVNFYRLDARWAQSEEGLKSFSENVPQVDIVLLMALLEHLTIEERINVLRTLWEILKPEGIIIIYDTPNRIAYFDWHSFWLPFFHWLPDQLALLYSVKTPRPFLSVDPRENLNENLYRIGRGVSYHEFELALNFENLTVINDGYSKHLKHWQPRHKSFDKAILEIFEEHLPHIPRGFTRPSLDLIIRKERNS